MGRKKGPLNGGCMGKATLLTWRFSPPIKLAPPQRSPGVVVVRELLLSGQPDKIARS